jgi:hypothetical protein
LFSYGFVAVVVVVFGLLQYDSRVLDHPQTTAQTKEECCQVPVPDLSFALLLLSFFFVHKKERRISLV